MKRVGPIIGRNVGEITSKNPKHEAPVYTVIVYIG